MNEQRTQAYLNLINQLLSCNEGDAPRILQENEELLDQGLIEVMVAVAQELEEAGRENQAQWLMNIAQQLAEALGLMDNATAEGANTPQDYLNFLMQVLLKVEENPSPQLIHPFLAQYFGQFLNREAMPTASFTNATQRRSQKSEWNLKPNKTEKRHSFRLS